MAKHQADSEPQKRPPSRRRSSASSTSHARDKIRPKSRTSTTSLQSVDVGHSFQSSSLPPDQHSSQHSTSFVPVQPQAAHPAPMQPYNNGQQDAPPRQPYNNGQQDAPPRQPYNDAQHNMQHFAQHVSQMPQAMPPHMAQQPLHNHMPQQVPYSQHIGPQMPQQQLPHGHYPHPSMAPPEMQHMPQQSFVNARYNVYPVPQPQYMPNPQHFRRDSMSYEGSPAPEDSGNENKRKKGTPSTLANDQELRRALHQHEGKTLKELAQEVFKTENQSGGRAEKAKQVFAMVWLRENCIKSTNAVRRDRVFLRYTATCGSERVPALNPASFGKLVRIIFPNVQTRRLGIRGESKYHYVELDLVPEPEDDVDYPSMLPNVARPSTSGGIKQDTSMEGGHNVDSDEGSRPTTRQDMETADFPIPEASQQPEFASLAEPMQEEVSMIRPSRLCCMYANTGTIRIPTRNVSQPLVEALPAGLPDVPGVFPTYEAMPQSDLISSLQSSGSDPAPVDLPDMAPYLDSVEHDTDTARTLYNLYRSHCTDIVEAFRKVRERAFFHHYNTFNGKMTVPVSKMFGQPCLAPWIQECDMRMYKAMARFVAPMILQNVPDQVWNMFLSMAYRLVEHVITAFHEKCPVHVVVAKAVPAARFANLLKKVKTANSFAYQLSNELEIVERRTSMWTDLVIKVDPEKVLEDSRPPLECWPQIQGILKHDLRTLLNPSESDVEDHSNSAFSAFLKDSSIGAGVFSSEALDRQSNVMLEKWISWIQCLPVAFQEHHPHCMLDWHERFWRSLSHQLGDYGADSFQTWWFAEEFATSLLKWMVEMQGLLMSEADRKRADEREAEKMRQILFSSMGKRKREADTYQPQTVHAHPTKRIRSVSTRQAAADTTPLFPLQGPTATNMEREEPELPEMPTVNGDEADGDLNDPENAGDPNRFNLPSLPDYQPISSPQKSFKEPPFHVGVGAEVDDSGIVADVEQEGDRQAKEYDPNQWGHYPSSDPLGPGVNGVMD